MLRILGFICLAWCGVSILTVLCIAIACRALNRRPQAWERIDLPQAVVDYRFAWIVACERAREASMRRHPSHPDGES